MEADPLQNNSNAKGISATIIFLEQYELFDHWGKARNDYQMVKNAEFLKARFIDLGLYGQENGEGSYNYQNPTYADPDFISVPSLAAVNDIVERATL